MPDPYRTIARQHLDSELGALAALPSPPTDGWIRTMREALGMTTRDLADRLGVTPQAVGKYERAEVAGTLRLATLHRIAAALGATARYALIPAVPLETQVEQQALAVARHEFETVNHSMDLEQQQPSPEHDEQLIADRARELRDVRDLWRRPT